MIQTFNSPHVIHVITTATTMTLFKSLSSREKGFTLVEVAVVLFIVGILLGTVLGPVAKQRQNNNINAVETQLLEIHDALLGFAALHGYLPCPATNTSNGAESRVGATGTNCVVEHGFVPSNTLGLRGVFNSNNLVLDAWGSPLRYSLNNVATWEYAKRISLQSPLATFSICSAANCSAGTVDASNIVAVVYSLGPDVNANPASADQRDNIDNDDQFVSKIPSEGVGSEFDDIVIWLSPNILAMHLVKSGQISN